MIEMDILILTLLFLFFGIFLYASFKTGDLSSFLFIFGSVVILFFISYFIISGGIDIVYCGSSCATTNYHSAEIVFLGFALILIAIGILLVGAFVLSVHRKNNER